MAVTFIQGGGTTTNSNATSTRAFSSNVTSGNRVVITAVKGYTDSTHTAFVAGACTKNAGTATIGSVTLDKTTSILAPGPLYIDVGIWSADVTGSGSLTMQVTDGTSLASSLFWVMSAAEVHSNEGSMTVDQTNSATNTTGAPDSGSVTPTNFDAVLFGVCGTDQGTNTAYTQDGAFTSIYEEPDGTSHQTGESIYRIMTSGSDSASWTAPNAQQWGAAVVAYREPAAGSSSVSPSISSSASASSSRSASPSASPSVPNLLIMERPVYDYVD